MALYLRIGRRILHSRVAINSFAFDRQNGRHSVPALQKLFSANTVRGAATESRRAEGEDEKPVHASEEHGDIANSQSAVKKDEHQDEKDHTALGGFMRGLIGGQTVAAQDEYVAEAKKQGLDVPPPPPPRRADLVPIKRRKRAEEESHEPQSIRDRLFSRFSGSAFMRGAFEAKERISERIDESNNPVVNFFRNIYDNVFAENEMAMVIREIREEDKNFTISEFLREVETVHVPSILGAYLTGDREKLKTLCTEEAYNMLNLSIREREQAKVTMDPNLLAISEVELSAARLLEDAPVLIVSFSTQQINCLRDPTGAVVEGKEDDIRALYYVWALVREVEYEEAAPTGGGLGSDDKKSAENSESDDEPSHSAEDGDKSQKSSETKLGDNSAGPPPWKMMEMVIRGAHSTI